MTIEQVGNIVDFNVFPIDMLPFFEVEDTALDISYLGGYDMADDESLTGYISMRFSESTQTIEQPFVLSRE